MRRLRAAFVACALAAAPAALAAQQTQAPSAHPNPPATHPQHPLRPMHPHPAPSGGQSSRHRSRTGSSYASGYPLVIDGSVVNRLLATPSPKPKRTPAARPQFGEQTFETHSTNDAR